MPYEISFAESSEYVKTGDIRSAVYVNSDISPDIYIERTSEQTTPQKFRTRGNQPLSGLHINELRTDDRTPELQSRVVELSIDNMKPVKPKMHKDEVVTTHHNTPNTTQHFMNRTGSFLSRATADYQYKTSDKDRFSDLQRSSTNRDNKTPRPGGSFIPYAGVPIVHRHTTKLAPKKTMVSK